MDTTRPSVFPFVAEPNAALVDYPVVVETPVAWGQLDAFNHLNNTVYFRFFEDARMGYFSKMGILASDAPSGVGPILHSTSCRFRAPIGFPDSVEIGASVTEVGEDRFRMLYAVYSRALGRIAATGEGLLVTFDYGKGVKAPVPADWREAIARLEGQGTGA